MSTRGAFGFKLDQKEVVFYNHSGSYPDGLGQEVVDWIRSVNNWNVIRDRVKDFQIVEYGVKPTIEQKAKANQLGTVNLGVSEQSEDDWYCLTRNAQGNIDLTLRLGFGITKSSFLLDSLFCEYAYIINLDTMEIEFYEGFNTNFSAAGRYANRGDIDNEYAGVKLVGEAPLKDIPEDWVAKFYPSESEEDE